MSELWVVPLATLDHPPPQHVVLSSLYADLLSSAPLLLLPSQAAWSHPQHSPAPSAIPRLPITLTMHCPRDLTDNQLAALPLAGLGGLVHLKLRGNPALSQAFSKDSFPKLR